MPIALECDCSKKLRVKDELAGRKIRCPECKGVIAVPVPEVEVEPEPEDADAYVTPDEPKSSTASKSKSKSSEDDDDSASYVTAEMPKTKSKSKSSSDDDDDEEDDEDKPAWERKRKERKRDKPKRERRTRSYADPSRRTSYAGGLSINSGSIIAGILMMVGAVIWFVAGFLAGWIYFYPIFLFIAGIAAVVKGMRGES